MRALVTAAALALAASAAHAQGFEAERVLTPGPGDSNLTYNFHRTVAAVGKNVYVVSWSKATGHVSLDRSEDDGTTFARQQLSTRGGAEHASVAASGPFVHVVWHQPGQGMEVHIRSSSDGGRSFGPDVRLAEGAHASVAAEGTAVHVAYGYHVTGESEVHYRRSLDGGATFSPDRRLTDTPNESWVPTIEVSGQDVYLAWVDLRDGNEEEYLKHSPDGGVTWGPDRRVTAHIANSWAPSLAVSGRTVHFAWFDQKDAGVHDLQVEKQMLDPVLGALGLAIEPSPAGPYAVTTLDDVKRRCEYKLRVVSESAPKWIQGGGDPARLRAILADFDATPPSAAALAEAEARADALVALVGATVSAAGLDPLARIQAKAQAVQQAAPAWVQGGGDPAKLQALAAAFQQALAALPSSVYEAKEGKADAALTLLGVAFERASPIGRPVYYLNGFQARIGRKMAAASAAIQARAQGGADVRPLLTQLGEFQKVLTRATREWEIYYKVSTDGGITWGPEVRLTQAPGLSQRPSLVLDGGRLHVAWFDDRDGNIEAYFKESPDLGRTWGPDTRLSAAPGDSMFVCVAAGSHSIHVVWEDKRDGTARVHYRRRIK